MPDPLVLDSSVFKFTDFIQWLRRHHGRKILPVVAYTEISVWYVSIKGKDQSYVDDIISRARIELEWYTPHIAWRAVEFASASGDFSDHARDYMIAAHAYTAPRMIVTENKKDFAFLGDRVCSPDELMYPGRTMDGDGDSAGENDSPI